MEFCPDLEVTARFSLCMMDLSEDAWMVYGKGENILRVIYEEKEKKERKK